MVAELMLREKPSGICCGPADKTDVSSVPVNMTTAVISFIVVVFWGGWAGSGEEVDCISLVALEFF
jgi:hypothetical protein